MINTYAVYINSNRVAEYPYTVDGLVAAVDKCSQLNQNKYARDVVHIVNPNNICCGLDDCTCHHSGLTRQEREVLDLFGEGYY